MNQQNAKCVVIVIVSLSLTIGWCPFLQDHADAYDLPTEKASLGPIVEWNKTYGGIHDEEGWMVQQTTDQGYILVGYTGSYGNGAADIWLVKTNANGVKEWSKTFGGTCNDLSRAVHQTIDGGYIVAGEKIISDDTDAWIIKTDNNGNILWDIGIGGTSDEYSCGVQQINETCYAIVGTTSSFGAGAKDIWLIKLALGNESLPPLKPTITGPTTGTVNHEYPYNSTTTDPDGDPVFYLIDWDDGTISDWLGPYNSGASCEATHTWTKKGTYTIKVKAKDTSGLESDWASLSVTMPCAYDLPLFHLLQEMIQRLSFVFPILWHLMEY